MTTACVDPILVPDFWPHVREFVRSAMDRCELGSFGHVERAVLEGEYLLWVHSTDQQSIDGALVTSLILTDAGKVCFIVAFSGHRAMMQDLAMIEAFARAEGCVSIRLHGRKGWQRILPNYQLKAVVLERSL